MTLEQLIQTVVHTFKDDPSSASVTLSFLPEKKLYYVSIIRYKEAFGKGKEVVLSKMGEDLEMVLTLIGQEFISE